MNAFSLKKKKLHMPLNYHFLRHFFVLQRYSLPSSSDLTPKNDVTKIQDAEQSTQGWCSPGLPTISQG